MKNEQKEKGDTEVTGDLDGPSVEWWGTVSGMHIRENGRKDSGDVKLGFLLSWVNLQRVCANSSMGSYSGRRKQHVV